MISPRSGWSGSDVVGMPRSRRLLVLVCLVCLVALTTFLLREQEAVVTQSSSSLSSSFLSPPPPAPPPPVSHPQEKNDEADEEARWLGPVSDSPASDSPASGSRVSDNPASDSPASGGPASGSRVSDDPASGGRVPDNPVPDNPALGGPASGSRVSDNPASDSPASGGPASGSRVSDNPVPDNPALGGPASGSRVSDSPASDSPASGGPASGGPASGGPASGSRVSDNPAPDNLASGGPASGGPASGGPASGSRVSDNPAPDNLASGGPASGGPASGGPASGSRLSDNPASDSPASGGPASGGPASGGPASGGPAPGGPASGSRVPDNLASDYPASANPASANPASANPVSANPVSDPVSANWPVHPIHQLVESGQKDFQALLGRQSSSLPEAVAEYRRRYKLPPPPNFDKWYQFAKKRGVQLIDEFDGIYHTLLPFWALEPAVIRERTREAIGFDNSLITAMIRHGAVAKMAGGGEMYAWHREATPIMLKAFVHWLPDMDLAFNIHDEPRVVLQHDDLARYVALAHENMPRAFAAPTLRNAFSIRPSDLGDGSRIKEYKTTRFNHFAHQPVWASSRMSCPMDSAARACLNDSCADNTAAYSANLPLGFIANTTAFSDICNSPSFERTFGMFERPNAFDVTHDLVPIFSQSKVSSFQDILYPSPWYYMGRVRYDEARDMPWEAKTAKMYWRGSTTGGFSRDGGWRRQHRQQFLTKIQPYGEATVLAYDASSPAAAGWRETPVSMQSVAHYFDVKFTFIGQCDPGDCDAQRQFFGTVEPVNMFDAFASRYLLDIDGNAFSGRYYAWLLSRSLVYKMAVFREWHDDWLKPWVHFVPLGLRGDEYVESVRYFDQEDEGRREARRLADASRNWAQKVLRNDDMEVWYFRLLLEYGRLVDDNRYDIGYME